MQHQPDVFGLRHFAREADQRAFIDPARQALSPAVVRGKEQRTALQRLAAEDHDQADSTSATALIPSDNGPDRSLRG